MSCKQTRSIWTRVAAPVVAACAAFMLSPALHADGTETLGLPSIPVATGNSVASVGVGLFNTGTASTSLELPPNAVIKQVLLYWEGPLFFGEPSMILNSQLVTGTLIGGPIANVFTSYRADITSLNLVKPGSNTLNFTAPDVIVGNPFQSVDGAGIYVIYDAGSAIGYGGFANGATVSTLLGGTVKVGATGNLPASGGALSPAPVDSSNPLMLAKLGAVKSKTVGTGGSTVSTTEVANVSIVPIGVLPNIGADVIKAKAVAQCDTAGKASVSGESQLAGLLIGGTGQGVSFPANTVLLNLGPVMKLVINEQTSSASGANGTIAVTGLHLSSKLLNADLAIAQTSASINCSVAGPGFVSIRDGLDFNSFLAAPSDPPEMSSSVPQTFTFPAASTARTLRLDLMVGHVDNDLNRLVVQIGDAAPLYFPGALNRVSGDLFDVVTSYFTIPAGVTKLTVNFDNSDNVAWIFAGVTLPPAGTGNLYSGQATAIHVDTKRIASVTVADTGPLPLTGGSLDATTASVALTNGVLLNSKTAKAQTTGAGNNSDSSASIESLNLLALGIDLKASVIASEAHAVCDASKNASVTGGSTLVSLVVQGKPVDVATTQSIPLPLGGKLVINEKIPDASAGSNVAGLTVNALRITVPVSETLMPHDKGLNLLNVVLATSHADIVCR